MTIKIDANIYRQDLRLSVAIFRKLIEYTKMTLSTIVMPRVVAEGEHKKSGV